MKQKKKANIEMLAKGLEGNLNLVNYEAESINESAFASKLEPPIK